MHILIACPTFYIGGFSSHAINLAGGFRKLGFQVDALVLDPYGQMYNIFDKSFDNIIILRRKFESRKSYLSRIISKIYLLSPDVIINEAVPFIQAAFPYLSQSIVKISVIHSILINEVKFGCANEDYLDKVVVVSNNIYKIAIEYIKENKVTIIPSGVNCPKTIKQNRIMDNIIKFIYIGRLSREAKNLPLIEDITKELYNHNIAFKLSIIGDGNYKKKMQQNLLSKPYSKSIHFMGVLFPNEIINSLLEHDIMLMTSTYEGTPHALLEAMALGVVPICSNIKDSTDKIIIHGQSGILCNISNVNDYINAIIHLKNNKNLYNWISINAQKQIKKLYSINTIIHQYLEIFKECSIKKNHINPVVDQKNKPIIPSNLTHGCPNIFRHLRRCFGDIYRRSFNNIQPINIIRSE